MGDGMVSYIWAFFIIVGSIYLIVTGNVSTLNEEILKGGLGG